MSDMTTSTVSIFISPFMEQKSHTHETMALFVKKLVQGMSVVRSSVHLAPPSIVFHKL
jgi:hypothetical protein